MLQWADTTHWTVRCDWLQVASVVTCIFQVLTFNFYLASFIVVVVVIFGGDFIVITTTEWTYRADETAGQCRHLSASFLFRL